MQKKEIDKDFCDRLKKIRENTGLNKSQFSETLNFNPSFFSDIERYKVEPSKDIIKKVISKFRVNANWLLTGEGEMYQALSAQKTNNEVPAIHGISADEREAIRIIRENPELKKALNLYSKIKNLDSTIPKLTIQVCPELI